MWRHLSPPQIVLQSSKRRPLKCSKRQRRKFFSLLPFHCFKKEKKRFSVKFRLEQQIDFLEFNLNCFIFSSDDLQIANCEIYCRQNVI